MRRHALHDLCATCKFQRRARLILSRTTRRSVQISAAEGREAANGASLGADARFEVLGTPFSLLSASISASQNLYTRRGTLVGLHGNAENAVSTLSLLEPFRRSLLGIPFLYQRVSSTTPYTALISTKSALSSLVVVHLDGRQDYMIAQRNALLAWTGNNLTLSPRMNMRMSLTHWGDTHVTGRGLLALAGRGLIHQITLKSGEEYVVHPSHVIAYSIMQHAPQPYRFKTNVLRFQVPNPINWLPDTRFWRTMRQTAAWRYTSSALFMLRTWARRTIWGDRLFLHFQGPSTILIQSRGAVLTDALTNQDVNEIADSPAGAVPQALAIKPVYAVSPGNGATSTKASPTTLSYASVNRGAVKFDREQQ